MLLNDRLNMETLGCTKCGGEIQGEITDQICNYIRAQRMKKREEDSPQRGLMLMVLTAALNYPCATKAGGSTRVESKAHLWRGYSRLRGRG